MDIAGVSRFVHNVCPHSKTALYLSSAVSALIAIGSVYLRCLWTGSSPFLPKGWIGRTAGWAAPIPIYILLLCAPLDEDLYDALKSDEVLVALAGLYVLAETLNDIREVAGTAHADKDESQNPT